MVSEARTIPRSGRARAQSGAPDARGFRALGWESNHPDDVSSAMRFQGVLPKLLPACLSCRKQGLFDTRMLLRELPDAAWQRMRPRGPSTCAHSGCAGTRATLRVTIIGKFIANCATIEIGEKWITGGEVDKSLHIPCLKPHSAAHFAGFAHEFHRLRSLFNIVLTFA